MRNINIINFSNFTTERYIETIKYHLKKVSMSALAWLFMPIMSLLGIGFFIKSQKEALLITVNKIFTLYFFIFLGCLIYKPQQIFFSSHGFLFDFFSLSFLTLILFIVSIVQKYSLSYMLQDADYLSFQYKLIAISLSTIGLILSDNIIFLLGFWLLNQVLLAQLLAHKQNWQEALKASRIYLTMGLLSSTCLGLGLFFLGHEATSFSLKAIANYSQYSSYVPYFLIFVFVATMIQAGVWPFHKWLISSLNSPTPVSAFFHAGIVSSGAFVLLKLSPLMTQHTACLQIIFVAGAISIIAGTMMKLISSSIKKMLVFSTVSQMGYMFVQIGLGLFPAAICHILWHSFFKSFLFLNSGSSVNQEPPKQITFQKYEALFCTLNSLIFTALLSQIAGLSTQHKSQLVFLLFPFFTLFFINSSILKFFKIYKHLYAVLFSLLFSASYGFIIHIFDTAFQDMKIPVSMDIAPVHILFTVCLIGLFILINFAPRKMWQTQLGQKIYVYLLKTSQSHYQTLSLARNKFKN